MQDLPSLLLSHGIHLKQVGNEYSCLCFAHDDKNPSMSVYINGTGKHVCHCFSCGFHGDVIDAYKYLSGNDDHKEAIKALEGDLYTGKPYATITNEATPKKATRTMLIPPIDTKPPKMGWLIGKDGSAWGEPDAVFIFRQPDGSPWMFEARWEIVNQQTGEYEKECRVFSYGHRGSAPKKWECSHHLAPRPLYGLDKLATVISTQAIVCEGPRKAEAAQKLLPTIPCLGWSGGAQSWSKSDWTPLADKTVILWPDADDVGRIAMNSLAQHLITLGCTVFVIDTSAQQDGWDAADAVKSGWDKDITLAWLRENKGGKIEIIEEKKTPEIIVVEHEPLLLENHSEGGSYDQPPIDDIQDDTLDFDDLPHTTINQDVAFTIDGITWTAPADVFGEISAPQINPEIMPECIREWMIDTAGVKGVDPSMLALSAIVASAGCLHEAIKIQPERTNPGWQESARLWGAVVGSSGIKKSPAIGAAVSRLKKIQLELSAQAIEKMDEVKAREMAYELANKNYIKALSTNDKNAVDKKPFKPEIPEIPRLFFEDITVEKLSEELKYSPRGAFILRDELAGWFGSHAQYRSSGTDAPAWLDFYEGGAKYIDRIGRGSIFVPNWGGCILGGIQPSTMQKIIENLPEDGLLQRFIVVNARHGTDGNELPYNKAANDRYHDMLQRLFDTAPGDTPVMLSPEANEIRREINKYSNKLVRTGMISTGFCSHLAKYEGLFSRLLLTFHSIECADKRGHPQGRFVSGETAARVKRFMLEFLLPHSIAFYINIAGQSKIGHAVKKVAELCLVKHDGQISTRDINHGWIGWRHYKQYDQETVLNALVEHGWILPHPKARTSLKGFPTRFLINPKVGEYHAVRKDEEKERRDIAVEAIKLAREIQDDD